MTEYPYSTADMAAKVGLGRKATRARAKALGLGIDRQGRAGFAYSEADVQKLIESMRPIEQPAKRRKRRAA